jgi:hypothetical protein
VVEDDVEVMLDIEAGGVGSAGSLFLAVWD